MTGWGECFKKNKVLIHVDISYNGLRLNDMKLIGESLINNHTILGIHIMGNEGEVDKKGFINAEVENSFENNSVGKSQLMIRINPIFNESTGVIKSKMAMQLQTTDNCWICEGF